MATFDQATIERFESKFIPEPNSGCWLWIGPMNGLGYGWFSLFKFRKIDTKRSSSYRAHRVSWMFSRGPIPPGMCVLHRCDVRSCVNPDHLFLGTNADNAADRVRKGRSASGARHTSRLYPDRVPRGTRHGNAKLTDEDVRLIRRSLEPAAYIAEKFGISSNSVYGIRRHHTWRHVE